MSQREESTAALARALRAKKKILEVAASLDAVCKGEQSGKRLWELVHLIQADVQKLVQVLDPAE